MIDLNKTYVSIKQVIDSNTIGEENIYEILDHIKNNPSVSLFEELRLEYGCNGKSKEYAKKKLLLPVVTFAGTFKNKFDLKSIDKMSGLMYCDIDNLKPQELYETREFIKTLPFVVAVWLSPSTAGLGFLVAIDNLTAENYSETYRRLSLTYFDNKLDSACQNINRSTFLSYDSNLWNNSSISLLNIDDLQKESASGCSVPIFEHNNKVNHTLSRLVTKHPLPNTFELEIENEDKVKEAAEKRERESRIRKTNSQDYINSESKGEWLTKYCKFFEEKVLIVTYFNKSTRKKLGDGTKGGRAREFWFQACNLLYLNPWLELEELIEEQRKINKSLFVEPLPDEELVDQTQKAFYSKNKIVLGSQRRVLWKMIYLKGVNDWGNVSIDIKRKNVGQVKAILAYRKNVNLVLVAVEQLKTEGKNITVGEVSKLSKVYSSTVSKILNEKGIERKKTIKERLKDAVESLYGREIEITRITLKEESGVEKRQVALYFKANINDIKELNETIKNNKNK